jgi:MFS family permease
MATQATRGLPDKSAGDPDMSTIATPRSEGRVIRTKVPARLDRLPWSRFHWRIVIGLGTVWILDGLEVTIVGAIAPRLTEPGSGIDLNPAHIGTAAAIYVAGACIGALFFGQLTDRYGRKKLFMATLLLYLVATVATAFATVPWFFFLTRFFTGMGIGGEYAAINSAIDELIPARNRGQVDLAINGSYWVGSALGAVAALFLLDLSLFDRDFGWRLAFAAGAILGLGILLVRRHVPESPRWLFIHGREEEAERIVDQIETAVRAETGQQLPEPDEAITIRQRDAIPFREIAQVAIKRYPRRAILGLALFIGQAFLYNAVVFDLGTILSEFFEVSSESVPYYMAIFALSNFMGPLVLGRLFDTIGRIPMISGTYLGSALLVAVLGVLLLTDSLTTWSFMALVLATFFLASAGASSAYLTVSEIFPMETRALAIALFFAVGTAAGGIAGPELFGQFIHSGDTDLVALGFFIGAVAMALGGIAELLFGVRAEQQSLENIARPLTAEEADAEAEGVPPELYGEPVYAEAEAHPEQREALRCRERAETQRAEAADHRAVLHELRVAVDRGNGATARRIVVEQVLVQVADLRAKAFDGQAAAHHERHMADGTTNAADRRASLARAAAGRERARAYEQRAGRLAAEHGLAEGSPPGTGARASAPGEAPDLGGARGELARAVDDSQDGWAAVRAARARASGFEAEGGDADAARHTREADDQEELALAADERVDAARHRVKAEELRGQVTEERIGRDEPAAGRERQTLARDERIRRRTAARRDHEREGLRRFRPGVGSGSRYYSPGMIGTAGTASRSAAMAERDLDREMEALQRILDERGPSTRAELATLLGARHWGPGRLRAALREALREGRARRSSGGAYGSAGDTPPGLGANGPDEHAVGEDEVDAGER